MFKRKVFEKLKTWKEQLAPNYAVLLEGARRVGKSTVAIEFAKQYYKSYVVIDFANIEKRVLDIFDDIHNLSVFFLRLQAVLGVTLYNRESVIIFDEIQLFPPARQAIKYLVKDGRYDYIETGSLISIKKNIKDIVIPSEEYKIEVFPMDFEEFMWATGNNTYELLRELYKLDKPVGDGVNRKLMRDFRIYMAIGGMPQVVQAYVDGKDYYAIDQIKRLIINLYIDDFKKIDSSGLIGKIYQSIPSQLATNKRRYVISSTTRKQLTNRDFERLSELIDSKTVLPCYNVQNPSLTLMQTRDDSVFKLYLSDIGLFVTMIFSASPKTGDNIYEKLLGDKLPADLGYLYENAVAQMIVSSSRDLYYHIWDKEGSTHFYEIDFLTQSGKKIIPFEVKSSKYGKHISLTTFCEKYNKDINQAYLISQKDVMEEGKIKYKPIYMLPFILEEL